MDADFSSLKFENININNARNDCLDFFLWKLQFKFCESRSMGDKGILSWRVE